MRHLRIALYETTSGTADEAIEIARKGFVPILESQPGFVRYDVGKLDDKSFNEFSYQGVIDAATELGGTHDVIVTEEIADYAANIQTFIDEGYDVVVAPGFLSGSPSAFTSDQLEFAAGLREIA